MLRYMKVKPYQFGLATISDFRDHSSVPRLRTNRNQLVNIYLMSLAGAEDVSVSKNDPRMADFGPNK